MDSRRGPRPAKWVVMGVAVAVLLVPAILAGGSYPFSHWVCDDMGQVAKQYMKMPAILVNSPYGGSAHGFGLMPSDFPGSPGYPNQPGGYGDSEANGSAGGQFFSDNFSLDRLQTALTLGAGPSSRCPAPYKVVVSPGWFDAATGASLLAPGSQSDLTEPSTVNLSGYAYHPKTPVWNNSFARSTESPIDTCGGPAQSIPVDVGGLPVTIQFPVGGESVNAPIILPFQLSFDYVLPANFGTWQVDNLSAPGGPGGGWAFSYSPCP